MALTVAGKIDDSLDIARLVRPVRLKLGINAAMLRVFQGATLTGVAIALVIVLSHFVSILGMASSSGRNAWILGIAAAGTLLSGGAAIKDYPTKLDAILIVDRKLALKDRLATAYQYARDDTPMMRLQRGELRSALGSENIARSAALHLPLREVGACLVVMVLILAAGRLPNPQATSAAALARDRAATQFSVRSVQQLLDQRIPPMLPASTVKARSAAPADGEMTKLLKDLAARLQAAESPRAALKSLAAALAQARQIASRAARDNAAMQSLAKSMTAGSTQSVASGLRSGDQHATARAMDQLQQSLDTLSPQNRASLAQTLARSANAAPPTIKQSLRRASFALGDNDPVSARQALKELAQQLSLAQKSAAAAPAAALTARQLADIQRNVANGATHVTLPTSSGKPSASSKSVHGKTAPKQSSVATGTTGSLAGSQLEPHGSDSNSGQSGQGNQTGSPGTSVAAAAAAASRAAAKSGSAGSNGGSRSGSQSGTGGAGSGGGSGAIGASGARASGQTQMVYLPGKRVPGAGIVQDGPLGSSIAITAPSFRNVVAQYSEAANIALDRVSLPPALQGEVKRYFAALQK